MKPAFFGKWGKLAQYTAVGILFVSAAGIVSSLVFSLATPVIVEQSASATPSAPVTPVVDPLANALSASSTVVLIGSQHVRVAVVDNDATREQGLSGVTGLLPDEGMLFVFQKPSIYAFWMKDMLFSIDMVWLSSDKKIVYIAADATPSSYPRDFVPKDLSLYVLELPAGYAHSHNLQIGEPVGF